MAKGKKQENPNKVAQRKAERVAFVQANPNLAPEVARQRFYVQTRAAELEAAGKDVDRAALRQKFQTGGVTREGFYTPADVNRFNAAKDNSNSLADSKSVVTPPVVSNAPTTPVAPKATPTPSTSKPSGIKTPSTSYQAPQVTTSLGQVANTPPPSGTLAAAKNNSGPNVRAGVGTRRIDTSMPTPGVPQIAGVTWRAPGVLPDAVITSPQQVPTPVKGKNQIRLSGKGGQNLAARAASNARWDREEFAADRLVNTGLVMGAEALGGYLGAQGGPASAVAGAALFAGAASNLTNRITNWRTEGRYKGDTTLAGAAKVSAVSGAFGGATLGVIKAVPKVAPVWNRVQNWANDVRVAAPAPKALEQTTGRAFGGTPGQVIETNLGRIAPRSMAIPGEQPFKAVAETVESKAANKVKDKVVNLVRRNKVQEATPIAASKSSPIILPAEPVAPKFTPEITRDSGLVIPATTNRTPAAERNPVFQSALEDAGVVSKPLPPESLDQTKKNIEAAMQEDGVKPYDQMTPQEKRKFTIAQKKALQQNIEIKAPDTVGSAKPDPVPNVTPKPAPMRVVEGEAPDRLAQRRNHPAFTSKLPEAQPSLSVVKDDGVREINISFNDEPMPSAPPAKRPPTQRPNESDATYAKRLDAWRVANEGEVFKAPAGFEQNRSSISYQEKAMTRIEGGMSRTNRSRTTAFISEPGMSPEGFPVQMEGESVMQFNIRASEFLKSRGKTVPQAPDNSFLAQGTPEPVSLDTAKAVLATENIPPRPPGLKNAAWDPETQQWRARSKNKAGEYKFVEKRTVYATEEERQAGTAARELGKQQNRKASRAAKSVEVKVKAETIAASGGPDAEYGPFMFGGEPIGRSRVTLTPGELPDWAQANTSLTTKPLSEAENVWLNRTLNPDEEAFFRELGNAKKRSAGRLTTRSTREATPADVEEYLRRMRGMRHSRSAGELEEGIDFGIDAAPLSDTQRALEKEIEQVLGSDALTALKNIALRRNTPPLTQNIRGLESLAEIKASGEPLINKLVVRQPTPSASGRLREQAAAFFNAQGKVKGVSGADRIRTWNRLTQSDWFRQLQESEPTFANFLREQNESLGRSIKPTLEGELAAMPKPMNLRQKRWAMESFIGKKEKAAAAVEFDRAIPDTGLGAYDLKGEELVDGVKAGDFKKGTTVQQRAQAAEIERKLKAEASLLRRIVSEDQAAFGDVNYFNRGFEQGQQLDPMIDSNVLKEYGIVDEKGFTNMNQSQFNIARRQLEGDIVLPNDSRNDAAAAAFEEERDRIFKAFPGKANQKQLKEALAELAQRNEPAGLPNPFAQRFGETLPKDYTRVIPESYGNVWDTITWTDEAGIKREGRWITPQEAADKKAKQAAAQAKLAAELEKEREAIYSKEWFASQKEQLARTSSTPIETPSPFDKYGFGKEWTQTRSAEEARRVASLERRAAQIKAETKAKISQTAEEFRFELKQKHEGTWVAPKKPEQVGMTREEMLMQNREEEARSMRELSEEGFDSFFMNLGDYFKE